MKKVGLFRRNPAPAFVLTTLNPGKRKKKKARRNGVASKAAGIAARAATKGVKAGYKNFKRVTAQNKDYEKSIPALKSAYKSWTKKKNPSARKKKKRNPLEIEHVIVDVPAKNPGRSRRKTARRKNSSATTPPPMKTRKRSRKRRNSGRRSTRGRFRSTSRRRRNPRASFTRGRKRRSVRRRNPGIVDSFKDSISMRNIAVGAGVLTGIVGSKWTINTIMSGGTNGAPMFNLPGVSPAQAGESTAAWNLRNKWIFAFYETALPWAVGWALRNQAPRFSEGLTLSAVVNLGVAVLKDTTIGQKAGLSAFLPRGTGTFIPGVPPILSGPATGFINNGAPVARRRGQGAVVNNRWANQTVTNGADPMAAT